MKRRKRAVFPSIAAKILAGYVDEVVECLSVSEFSTTPQNQLKSWRQGNVGRPFLVRFLAAQKMNAPAASCKRKLKTINIVITCVIAKNIMVLW